MPKNEQAVNNIPTRVIQDGTHSAVINGEIVHNIPSKMVYISDESELDLFTDEMPVGTYAATYGGANVWQLNAAGVWVEV